MPVTYGDILKHDRARTSYVVRPGLDDKGQPVIVTIARITTVYPKDGAGRLRVAIMDWGENGDTYPPAKFTSHAGGYGYDKRTAAMVGATVGGVELGDHSDHKARPTLDVLCRERGWQVFGS